MMDRFGQDGEPSGLPRRFRKSPRHAPSGSRRQPRERPTLAPCAPDRSAADRLRYYAQAFPLVEVDSTYYAPPSEQNARLWAQRTPPGFADP
jgi:hypothetical protein